MQNTDDARYRVGPSRRRVVGGKTRDSIVNDAFRSQDDLKNFFAAVNPLVSATNESHICIMVGKSKRQGSGLLVEAGQKVTAEILDLVTEVEKEVRPDAKLRVKSIQARSAPIAMKQSGISGSVTETVLYFWRGSWPSKQPARFRAQGGSTWDDVWFAPMAPVGAVLQVPYVIKSIVMEAPWLSMSAGAGGASPADGGDNNGDSDGESNAEMDEEVKIAKATSSKSKGKKTDAKTGKKDNKKDDKKGGNAKKDDKKGGASKKDENNKEANKKDDKKDGNKKDGKKGDKENLHRQSKAKTRRK